MDISHEVHLIHKETIRLRRDFHQHPELGGKEFQTSEKIVQYLKDLGIEVQRIAGTGVIGFLQGCRKGPTLMMRADMDALPIQDQKKVIYKSKYPGVMHACGHDGHIAMLLSTAKILSKYREELNGNIKFVFQPNEESAEGAKALIKEGVLLDPKVDGAIGVHLWSHLPIGFVGIKSGPIMAALISFKITVLGKGGHTGYPENAIDPIIAASDIIQKVQNLQTREYSQLDSIIIMFGKIIGGVKYNIIPDNVILEGTIRYLNHREDHYSAELKKRFTEFIHQIALPHRVQVEVDLNEKNKMLINHPLMTQVVQSAAKNVVGERGMVDFSSTASEDFSEFSYSVPSVFYFLGCGSLDPIKQISHHSSCFDIDEGALAIGIEIFLQSAFEYFNRQS